MHLFRQSLLVEGSNSLRDSVDNDLRSYFTNDYFSAGDAQTPEAADRAASWAINLLRYACLQAGSDGVVSAFTVGSAYERFSRRAR